jgi:prepilin-type N-terminal cleavage/methylation domain-containing protein
MMKNKKGFTLVELLVVIAIIGILSTVAVVNLNSARIKAKAASAIAWGSTLKPAVIFCDSQESALRNPMEAVGSYSGGSLCIPDIDVDWPAQMSEGYNHINILPDVGGDGVWQFEISDNPESLLPVVRCNNSDGCVSL